MKKKWQVKLSDQEISQLEEIVKKGKSSARTIRRTQTLFLANEGKTMNTLRIYLNAVA